MRAGQNELITRIGPGTPCGNLLRRYWQPAALLDEFDPVLDPAMALRHPGPGQSGVHRAAGADDCSQWRGTGALRLVRPARCVARQDPGGQRRRTGHDRRRRHGRQLVAQGHIRSHGVQGLRAGRPGCPARIRRRCQPDVVGRSANLPPVAAGRPYRLGVVPAMVPGWHSGTPRYPAGSEASLVQARRCGSCNAPPAGSRVPQLPHSSGAG